MANRRGATTSRPFIIRHSDFIRHWVFRHLSFLPVIPPKRFRSPHESGIRAPLPDERDDVVDVGLTEIREAVAGQAEGTHRGAAAAADDGGLQVAIGGRSQEARVIEFGSEPSLAVVTVTACAEGGVAFLAAIGMRTHHEAMRNRCSIFVRPQVGDEVVNLGGL